MNMILRRTTRTEGSRREKKNLFHGVESEHGGRVWTVSEQTNFLVVINAEVRSSGHVSQLNLLIPAQYVTCSAYIEPY